MALTKVIGAGVGTLDALALSNGNGVSFAATSDGTTMSSELLDDYEEGSYVVTATCGTSGTVTLNSSFDTASYTKIGRLVHVCGFIAVGSVSSPVGFLALNLPFTPANAVERRADSSVTLSLSIPVVQMYQILYAQLMKMMQECLYN